VLQHPVGDHHQRAHARPDRRHLRLAAVTSRSKSALKRGLKRIAASAGRSSARRSRALPALDMDYDDERELTRYVWAFDGRQMTAFERRDGMAGHAEAKAAAGSPAYARFLRKQYGLDEPDVQTTLSDRAEAFRRRVCQRLLAAHGNEVFVNRYPACGRVVRTPQDRQCFWCDHDWHDGRS
jgi:hypothetical protein